jgi:hypothetical protein
MMPQTVKRSAAEIRELEQSAVRLLTSLKGVAQARVAFDDAGQVARIAIVPHATDDRSAMRNVQSALMAVMGVSLDINAIAIVDGFDAAAAATRWLRCSRSCHAPGTRSRAPARCSGR